MWEVHRKIRVFDGGLRYIVFNIKLSEISNACCCELFHIILRADASICWQCIHSTSCRELLQRKCAFKSNGIICCYFFACFNYQWHFPASNIITAYWQIAAASSIRNCESVYAFIRTSKKINQHHENKVRHSTWSWATWKQFCLWHLYSTLMFCSHICISPFTFEKISAQNSLWTLRFPFRGTHSAYRNNHMIKA
jgi:hypothetical protein